VETIRACFDEAHIKVYANQNIPLGQGDVIHPTGEAGLVANLFPKIYSDWFADVVEVLTATAEEEPPVKARMSR
jgi:hypothetical protein